VSDDWSSRESSQELEDLSSILQQATGELSHDEGMTEHLLIKKQVAEMLVGSSKVVDPYRRVDEDHTGFERARVRRRGMRRALLSDPPNAASRLALSRATSASRPALTTAVFSRSPLSWAARSSNASSMFSVVRICISMAISCISVKVVAGDSSDGEFVSGMRHARERHEVCHRKIPRRGGGQNRHETSGYIEERRGVAFQHPNECFRHNPASDGP
jgi:hypothetical protein